MTQVQLNQMRQHVLDSLQNHSSIDKKGVWTITIPAIDIMALNAVHEMCSRELLNREVYDGPAEGGAS